MKNLITVSFDISCGFIAWEKSPAHYSCDDDDNEMVSEEEFLSNTFDGCFDDDKCTYADLTKDSIAKIQEAYGMEYR